MHTLNTCAHMHFIYICISLNIVWNDIQLQLSELSLHLNIFTLFQNLQGSLVQCLHSQLKSLYRCKSRVN